MVNFTSFVGHKVPVEPTQLCQLQQETELTHIPVPEIQSILRNVHFPSYNLFLYISVKDINRPITISMGELK